MIPDLSLSFLNSDITSVQISQLEVEAARYAVLRRLSPALRHHMVRNLQPIGMIYGVMDHRLSAPQPDVLTLHSDARKINSLAKAALIECIDVGTWLAPEPGTVIALGYGVAECVNLMATNLNFRGFQLLSEVTEAGQYVQRDALRTVLAASLFAATDTFAGPAVLTLSSAPDIDRVMLYLDVRASEEGESQLYDDGYRKLLWSDVRALAAFEEVSLSLQNGVVTMGFTLETSPPAH